MSDGKSSASLSFISAVNGGKLKVVKKFVESHGLSRCREWYGANALLRDTIKSNNFEIASFLLQEDAKITGKIDCGTTSLHVAAEQNCLKFVHSLLKVNVPIDPRNDWNETPLHLAAKGGHDDVVKVLLCNNASVTALTNEGSTPLLLAVEGGHERVVEILLKHASAKLKDELVMPSASLSEKKDSTLLDRILLCSPSARNKVNNLVVKHVMPDKKQDWDDLDGEIVQHLLDHGFTLAHELANESLLLAAMENGYGDLVVNFLKSVSNLICFECFSAKYYLLLLESAYMKDYHQEIVEQLLNSRSDANAADKERSFTEEDKWVGFLQMLLARGADVKEAPELLHIAVNEGFVEVCKLLIENGANVNALSRIRETPLFISCGDEENEEKRQRKDKIVKLLLENGAGVSFKTSSFFFCGTQPEKLSITAFHHAAYSGRKEAVILFLDSGLDVDFHDGDGLTPLHLAKSAEVAETLLKFGADVNARGPENITALHSAFLNPHKVDDEVVTVLLNHGCEFDAKASSEPSFFGHTAVDFVLSKTESHFNNYNEVLRQHGYDAIHRSDAPCENIIDKTHHDMIRILKRHVLKLKAAGLYVDGNELNKLNQFNCEDWPSDCKMSGFEEKCKVEINEMKNEQVDPQFALFDVLAKAKNPTYAKNKELMQTLEDFNLEKFPIYRGMIKGTLARSGARLKRLNSGQRTLHFLMNVSSRINGINYSTLPLETREQIVSYLKDSELNNLIACGEALKHQVKHQSSQ